MILFFGIPTVGECFNTLGILKVCFRPPLVFLRDRHVRIPLGLPKDMPYTALGMLEGIL